MEKGKQEGKKEIVSNLIALNFPDEIIMQATGLSIEEVQQIREH